MKVRVARVRPSLLIIGAGLMGPAAFAFDLGDGRTATINSPVFPAFIDATRFADLAAAHKALLARGVGVRPTVGREVETRRRAEELGWGLHAPKGAEAPIAIAETATDESLAWEAAARRAADELAREQAGAPEDQAAAEPVTKPAQAAKSEVKTPGKADATPPGKPVAGDTKQAAKPAPQAGKDTPPKGAAKAPAETAKLNAPPKPQGRLAPPSGLGGAVKPVPPSTSSWRGNAIPTEPSAFGWDNRSN